MTRKTQNFRLDEIKISQEPEKKNKYILLHTLGSKHSLFLKFGLFISYCKRKHFIKKFYQSCELKISSRPFFEASYLYHICNSKTIQICPNQDADLLRFHFTEYSLKIKKDLELVSSPSVLYNLLIKIFLL